LASGSAHPELTQATADYMGVKVWDVVHRQHADGELYVHYKKTIRGKDVFIMQPHVAADGRSPQDAIFEHYLLIDAARRASANSITAVAPLYGYGRSDRKVEGREPIGAALNSYLLEKAGVNRIVSVELHSAQVQGAFPGPFDQLTAGPVLCEELIKTHIQGKDLDKFLVVSPDLGGVKIAERYADELQLPWVPMFKKRDPKGSDRVTRSNITVPEADGRICFLPDDLIATGGTLVSAATILKESGAEKVIAVATHGTFSDSTFTNLRQDVIDEVVITDTVPMRYAQERLDHKLRVVSVAPPIGQAIIEIATGGSVSKLFGGHNHS
ncbi:MAG: ribose-phosphate pyrophosphokinae, partial [Candidatus Saccharibacteria bacterium]|nr:ribose-phosphate pyrophosphokinae [Candidatus Saccharibacteria bacterium]